MVTNHARFRDRGARGQSFPPVARPHDLDRRDLELLDRRGRYRLADADLSWQSKVFDDKQRPRWDLQPPVLPWLDDRGVDEFCRTPHGLLNIRLGFETEDAAWRITGFVNNVTDQDYLLDAGNVGDNCGADLHPRAGCTAGVEIGAKF